MSTTTGPGFIFRASPLDVLLAAVDAGLVPATSCKMTDGREIMQLRFLGKDSTPTNSPTLYSSDEESYVVQGWIVRDAALLARLDVDDGDDMVEIHSGARGVR